MQSLHSNNVLIMTEQKLVRMKELKDQIKVLEAEYKMLQADTISTHFAEHDTYVTYRGLVLATYKESIRTQFDTTGFKKAEPVMYEKFLDLKSVRTFLLK